MFITLHIFAVLLTSVIIFEDIRVELEEKETIALQKQLDTKVSTVELFLTTIEHQVVFTGQSPILTGLASSSSFSSSSDITEIYDGIPFVEWKIITQNLFYSIAENNPIINKIRYIDIDGNELVKIEQRNSKINIIEERFLQNKADRLYFSESENLHAEIIHVSNLDLSEEFGEVTYPYVPVIRYVTSIEDNFGEKQGTLVFNVDARTLRGIVGSSSIGDSIMIDNDGNFLLHPDDAKEFSLQLGTNYNYFTEQPELKENVQSLESKIHTDAEDGEYRIWKKIHYDPDDDEKFWVILTRVTQYELFAPVNHMWTTVIIATFVILSVTAIITIFFANRITSPIVKLKHISNKIASGKFDQKIDINTNDEISDLANSVYHMSESLKKNFEIEKQLALTEQKIKNNKFQEIGQFTSRLSHDLRNPVAILQNSIEIISQLPISHDERLSKQLKLMSNSTNRILLHVENLLDFVRVRPLVLNETSISDILKSIEQNVLIPKSVTLDLPKDDLVIKCDKEKIVDGLSDLISNSIQAMSEVGEIKIRIFDSPDEVILTIEDAGPGIPQELITKIFEPLFTTKQKGTGLGLMNCKTIIEQHGGSISVKNNPTTFYLKLPKNLVTQQISSSHPELHE